MMVIASEVSRSGPYTGNGSTTTFAYGFTIYDKDDIQVIKTTVATGAEATLTVDVDYTVAGVGAASGSITHPVSGSAMASTHKLTILRNQDLLQGTALNNQGGYVAETHERAWDETVQMIQQVSEKVDRSLVLPASSASTGLSIPDPSSGKPIKWKSDLSGFENGSTDLDAIITDATAQATVATAQQVIATAQAVISTAQAVAAAASYDAFDDRFLGAKSSDPSVDNDGDALATGALYWNSSSNQMFAYTGSAWSAIKPTSGEQTNIDAVAADASDIGAVAAKATEIGRLGTSDAVADLALLGTSDVVADLALLATSDVVAALALLGNTDVIADMALLATTDAIADMNTLATSDIVSDLNTLATSDIVSDLNTLATSDIVTDMNTLGTSANVTNMATVATNIAGVNSFAERYRVASSDPASSLDEGDLVYNSTSNTLKYYNGSAWVTVAAPDITAAEATATSIAMAIALG